MIHLTRKHTNALLTLATLAMGAATLPAMAQAPYPTKPITLVVTYPPGGGADAMARLIAPKMGEALGPRWPVQIPPSVATPNSPRQGQWNYDGSVLMASRLAASLSL